MRIAPALVCAAVATSLPALADAQDRFRNAVEIGSVDSVWSATLEEYRPFLVYTPPSYDDPEAAPHRYPVLYLLDGNAHFHSVTGIVQALATGVNGTFAIPEMIVVAIPNTNRTRDLTPTRSEVSAAGGEAPWLAQSGGNPDFLRFLSEELATHVDATYRTMPYRVFVGHSFGGIATLNALYTMPDDFDAYVAIDPSLWWDDRVLLSRARSFFAEERLEGKALYVAHANTISPDALEPNNHFSAIASFDAVMRAYDRSGIRYAFRYYPDDSHGSVPLIAEYDALRFVFDGYALPVQRILSEPTLLTEHFDAVSARLGADFRPPEHVMARITGIAMNQSASGAGELARMAVSMYPETARPHELLADVAAAAGDAETARLHYGHALARRPGDADVREKLDRLSGEG